MKQQTSIEQLYCALLFLLSRYARSPEPHLPGVIADHLDWLVKHPDVGDFPALQQTCGRLALHWRSIQGDDLESGSSGSMRRGNFSLH